MEHDEGMDMHMDEQVSDSLVLPSDPQLTCCRRRA